MRPTGICSGNLLASYAQSVVAILLSSVKTKPFGCYAVLTAAGSPLNKYYRGRKNASGLLPAGQGRKNMSTDNRKLKAIACITFRCEGVSTRLTPPLLEKGRAGVSLTVYEDGLRELGCSYLNKDTHDCMADEEGATRRCIHLYPVRARYVNMERTILIDGKNSYLESDWSKFRPNSHN